MVKEANPRSPTRRWGTAARFLLAVVVLAQALPAAAAETVLSLGVLRDDKVDSRLTRAIRDRLTRAGETLSPTTDFPVSERQCTTAECFEPVATRENAQLVLSARLQQSAGFAYITAILYDAQHKRTLDSQAVCNKCLPEAITLRAGDLFDRLLRDHRDRLRAEAAAPRKPTKASAPAAPAASANAQAPAPAKPAAASPPPETASTSPTAQAVDTEEPALTKEAVAKRQEAERLEEARAAAHAKAVSRPPMSQRKKLALGILGGIGVVSLVAAISLHATDGTPTSMDCDAAPGAPKFCVLDNKLAYSLGYGLTGAMAVAVGVTLALPESGSKKRQSEVN